MRGDGRARGGEGELAVGRKLSSTLTVRSFRGVLAMLLLVRLSGWWWRAGEYGAWDVGGGGGGGGDDG